MVKTTRFAAVARVFVAGVIGHLHQCSGEGFVFTEDEAGTLRLLHCGLGFERGEASAHRLLGIRRFDSRQLKLNLLAVTRADLDEGVESAGGDLQPQPFGEEPGDLPVGSSLTAEFSDQFAVRLQLRARWLRWEIDEFGEQTRRLAKMSGRVRKICLRHRFRGLLSNARLISNPLYQSTISIEDGRALILRQDGDHRSAV
jgi:hypothetical protein